MPLTPPDTPQLDRLNGTGDQYATVREFLEWIVDHPDLALNRVNHAHHGAFVDSEKHGMHPECFGQDPDCPLVDHPDHAVSRYPMAIPTYADDHDRITLEFLGCDHQAVTAEREAIARYIKATARQS